MPKPKVVVFDLGKVLLDFDFGKASRALSAHCTASEPEIRIMLDQSPLLHQCERGEITAEQFFQAIQTASGFNRSFTDFAPLFGDIFEPIPEMIQLNEDLRRAGFKTYIFSNTSSLAAEHIRERYPFFINFDAFVLSYECGCMKPDARIYERVEQVTGCKGAEILYIDDRLENIEAGAARGWQTIHQTNAARSVANARQLTGVLEAVL
ncbi:MAG TPA: HAD family phosphatase [Methylomirabilota bacterium]|nr:HAD family phosphatase [Methylomirabilota bacterium]